MKCSIVEGVTGAALVSSHSKKSDKSIRKRVSRGYTNSKEIVGTQQ